jgi:hypothetical protein
MTCNQVNNACINSKHLQHEIFSANIEIKLLFNLRDMRT